MLKAIARLVFRGDGPNDGLIFGAAMNNHSFFEPSTVYEIVDVLGDIIIRKVGTSAISPDTVRDEGYLQGVCWNNKYSDIIQYAGPCALLTKDEYKELDAKQQNSDEL